jgi:hypothetical protein
MPSNIYAIEALERLLVLNAHVWYTDEHEARTFLTSIEHGICTHGVDEVDGWG